jgi:hypothetical protein
LDHHFTSHTQRECVETHILKLGWSRIETSSISESKKIKFEYSFEWIVERYERTQEKYFVTLNIYVSNLV